MIRFDHLRSLDQVTDENERLHTQAADAQSQPGVTHQEWKALSENAHLVLEENELLSKQVLIQKDKQAEMMAAYHEKESELTARLAQLERLFEELRGRYTSERLSLLTKLRAANKTAARLERRLASLQGELDSALKVNSEASEHLAEVLSATDQLMAERSQLSRLSTTQLSDGDKLMERISEERAHALRLKDKVKTVRKESLEQLQQLQFEMGDQARSHEIRVSEYERQLAYLRSRLNEKQQEAEQARVDTK
ncbi:centrosomal protein of 89 kDa-like [Pollicipes pollicipes]|uniref:centrosomal protein of 89 kDa-like n=1 Tax=Pollicipes pollicipes TaxID=41117 RepID=UPI0018857B25|nr:centrosomal protein of 89 kDa-like [Pollicipes pollicipes]